MRIVFVSSGLARGGAEIQLIATTTEFVRRGHAVAIYTLNKELDRLPELEGSGVEVCIDQKRMKLDFLLLFRLIRFLRSFKADLVQGFLYDGNFYGRLAAKLAGIPALDSERSDNYELNGFQKMGETVSRHLAWGVVANSQSGARFAQNLYSLPDERMHVVWNGIDLTKVDSRVAACHKNYRREFFGTAEVKIAVLVGNIKPAKDYRLALETARELIQRAANWRVLFLGDEIRETNAYKQEMLDFYETLPQRDHIVFGGRRADAIEIMSQCDVLFSTSRHEGFPNVVLEAMTVGLPAASTDYSDIRQILPVDWQVNDERNPARMADIIERASRERQMLVSLQRNWVEKNASIEASADKLEAVFRHYLARHNDDNEIPITEMGRHHAK